MVRNKLQFHFFGLLLVASVLWLASCAKNPVVPETPSQKVNGVLQTQEGYTVPQAVIEAYDSKNARVATDTTDDLGNFSLQFAQDPNSVNLRISHPDYKTATVDLSSLIAQTGGHDGNSGGGIAITMESDDTCCGTIALTVTHEGTAVNDAEVRLRRDGHQVASGYTNDGGHITFHHVCAGTFNVRIAKTGYSVVEQNITVADCDSVGAAITMQSTTTSTVDSCCNGVLTVQVRDSSNNSALNGATVRISRGGVTHTATTADGHVTFHELCNGTYVININREHYRPIEFTQTLTCSDTLTITKLLGPIPTSSADSCCAGHLTVYGRDSATNALLNGGTVNLWHGGVQIGTATLSSGGTTFEHLCEGTYSVSISKDGYHGIEFSVNLGCNGTETATRLLSAVQPADTCCGGSVSLSVIDSSTRAALSNASVILYKSGTQVRNGTTNGDGHVTWHELCAGNYRMTINHDGYNQSVIEFELGCNATREFSRSLYAVHSDSCCSGVFQLHVIDSASEASLQGVTVTIRKNDVTLYSGTTTDGGNYSHGDICNHATYVITFSKDGYHSKSISWSVTQCQTMTETIRLVHN